MTGDLRELRHLCGHSQPDFGEWVGVAPSMSQKGSLMLRKKYRGKPAQKIAKNESFLGTTYMAQLTRFEWQLSHLSPAFCIWHRRRNSRFWASTLTSEKNVSAKNRSPEMISFFLYCIKKCLFQAHRTWPPTTGVVELWKKTICNENQWNWVVFPQNLMHIFTGDLYYMYAILQGIGSLPCIRIYIIYVIPFGK